MDGMRDLLRELLWQGVVVRFFADGAFREGCLVGLAVAGVGGLFGNWCLGQYNRIDRFFQATSQPAVRQGPSPSDRLNGCTTAAVRLFVVAVALLVLFYWLFISRP